MMNMKKVIATMCAVATIVSMNAGPVAAANVKDVTYKYTIGQNFAWHSTDENSKENNSKVYVKPEKSPSGKTYVQTYCRVGGESVNETKAGKVTLSNNVAYAITNYVYERGDKTGSAVKMWLKLKPTSGIGTASGVWSPDWTGKTKAKIV